MFPEKVKSVTLDKSRITYYLQTTNIDNIYNELPVNPEIYKVEDLAFDCSIRSSQYLPDYAIKGYFKVDENLRYPVFIENTNGPHLLYITGMPKNISVEEKNKFRFQNLFQVVSREQSLIHLIKSIICK